MIGFVLGVILVFTFMLAIKLGGCFSKRNNKAIEERIEEYEKKSADDIVDSLTNPHVIRGTIDVGRDRVKSDIRKILKRNRNKTVNRIKFILDKESTGN